MREVAYNQSVRGENYYGFGVIQATPFNNLNEQAELEMTRGGNPCMKEEILYEPNQKVPRNAPNNYKMIIEEPSMKMNYDQRAEQSLDRGVMFTENVENQNLDFDGDGELDMDFIGRMVNNDKSEELQDLKQSEVTLDQPIEEKSVKVNEVEKPIIESHNKIVNEKAPGIELAGEQEVPKTYEKPKNELKSVTAKRSDTVEGLGNMKMADGIAIGAGALALAFMVLGRG